MRVYQLVIFGIAVGTGVPIYLHHEVHGVFNVHQAGLAFFLWLNTLVALWEICLYLRIDLIEEQHARFVRDYRGRELDRVKDFFSVEVPVERTFSPGVWAELWSSYSVFDPSYADRKSFGFFVDIGNGFTTLVPALLFLYGMTYEPIPARALGIVGLLLFYQMWYGTVVYLASYLMNKRYRGHSPINVALFVGLSNGLWLTFPIWGIVVSILLIGSGSYEIFH